LLLGVGCGTTHSCHETRKKKRAATQATDILIFHRIPPSGLNNAKSTAEMLKVTGRVTGKPETIQLSVCRPLENDLPSNPFALSFSARSMAVASVYIR
jgi:hypothetical protein